MTKREQVITAAKAEIGKGIYVWGAKGQVVSDMTDAKRAALFKARETSDNMTKEQNIARCEALYQKRTRAGIKPIRAFDCSGFVYYIFNSLGLLKNRYAARTLYKQCPESTDKTGMQRDDLRIGDLVFRYYSDSKDIKHVSIYAGNGMVIESGGRDVGVQMRTMTAKDNRYGSLAALRSEPERMQEETPVQDQTFGLVRVRYGTVNVRTGNNKGTNKIRVAHGGETFPLLLVDPETGWYKIRVGDQEGYISNREDLTEVIKNAG